VSDENPRISSIIKALNSPQRREILRTLNFFRRSLSFTELMKELDQASSSSSQFSYHINVLLDAGLIQKTSEGKYELTAHGNKTGLLLEMSQEDEKSAVFSELYLSFSNMTPRDCLIAITTLPLLLICIHSAFYSFNPFLLIPAFLLLIGGLIYLYSRVKSLLAMIFFTNVFWVIFVPGKYYLGLLYFTAGYAFIPVLEENFLTFPFDVLFSFTLIIVSIIVAILYYISMTRSDK